MKKKALYTAATSMDAIAIQMQHAKPDAAEPFRNRYELIVYHLRTATRLTRELADASKEEELGGER